MDVGVGLHGCKRKRKAGLETLANGLIWRVGGLEVRLDGKAVSKDFVKAAGKQSRMTCEKCGDR